MSNDRRRAQLIEAYDRDQPATAAELARLYLAAEPDDRTALLFFGDVLTDLARYSEARAVYERALELSSAEQRTAVLRQIGRLYDHRGELREAERYYREAMTAAPGHASAYVYLGVLLARAGRLDEAELVQQRGTECVEGEIAEAFLNLGLVQRGRGDYVAALHSLRRALQLDPTYTEVQDALVDVEQVLFEFPEAEG